MNKINPTTYGKVVKDNPKDRIEVEIGDSKQQNFFPQAKIMRWDNEVNFSLRRKGRWNRASQKERSGKIEYGDDKEIVRFYELPDIS